MKKLSMSVVAFGILSGFGDGARRFLEKKKEDARASPLRYTKIKTFIIK
jgi:hypothetical protein